MGIKHATVMVTFLKMTPSVSLMGKHDQLTPTSASGVIRVFSHNDAVVGWLDG